MSKLILLKQRNSKSGRFEKSEPYTMEELREEVLKYSGNFFTHIFLGGIRRKALDVVIGIMEYLIDQDVIGKGSPK